MIFKNPPLAEAVCEIAFEQKSEEFDPTLPGIFYATIKDEYPEKKEIQNFKGEVPTRGEMTKIYTPLTRFNDDNGRYIQLTKDYIIFNKVKPDINWLRFKGEVLKNLENFVELNKNNKIVYCALKYLNVISIPINADFEEYFSFYLSKPTNTKYSKVDNFTSNVDFEIDDNIGSINIKSLSQIADAEKRVLLELTFSNSSSNTFVLDKFSSWLDDSHSFIENLFVDSLGEKLKILLNER